MWWQMFWYWVCFVIVVFIIYYHTLPVPAHDVQFELGRDGVQLFKTVVSPEKIQEWRTLSSTKQYQELKNAIQNDPEIREIVYRVSPDYVLQDYIWIIEKSAVHTCHRDNNGTFFNHGQQHLSYTMLVYLEDMGKCLGVIPQSHLSPDAYAVNLQDQVVDIVCSAGDVIVFDANLVHVGTIVDRDDNLRVQMKISHPDDLEVLGYYQNFNKVLNKDNTNSRIVRQLHRHLTCAVPYLANMTQQENIRSARGTEEGAEITAGQKLFSHMFYGNANFYDLPNAF